MIAPLQVSVVNGPARNIQEIRFVPSSIAERSRLFPGPKCAADSPRATSPEVRAAVGRGQSSGRDEPEVLVEPVEDRADDVVRPQRNVTAFERRVRLAVGRRAEQPEERQL
jgi:hypothetical protein